MNLLRCLVVLISAFAMTASALAQDTGVLHLDPLHLEFPASWKFNNTKRPIEGLGPEGEKLLVSVMRRREDMQGQAPSIEETAKGFAEGPMAQLMEKNGKTVVRPVSKLPTAAGKVGYSAGTEALGILGGKHYFIQYLLATPGIVIYLTFEGKGEARAAMQRFDKFFETQRWDY